MSHKKEYVVINAIYFTPIFRFLLASNLYPAIAFLLRDWVVLLIIVISQGKQVNFSVITSSYKAGKIRAEMRTGSILVLIFFLNQQFIYLFCCFYCLQCTTFWDQSYHHLILTFTDFNVSKTGPFSLSYCFPFQWQKLELSENVMECYQFLWIFLHRIALCHFMPL